MCFTSNSIYKIFILIQDSSYKGNKYQKVESCVIILFDKNNLFLGKKGQLSYPFFSVTFHLHTLRTLQEKKDPI